MSYIVACLLEKTEQQAKKPGTKPHRFIVLSWMLKAYGHFHLPFTIRCSESFEEAHKPLTLLQVLTFPWRTDIFYRIIIHHDWSSIDKLKTQPLFRPGSDSLLK